MLLSASAAAINGGTTQALIGLLPGGQITLRTAELNVLNLAGELLPAGAGGDP